MKVSRCARGHSISFKVTAMIDMTFLLITFFIMSIRFGQQGDEHIKLPSADQAKEVTDQRVDLVTVNVTKDGTFMINGISRTNTELLRYIDARKDEADKIELVVRGDRGSEFNAVQRVMRLSAEAGVTDVSLAALQLAE